MTNKYSSTQDLSNRKTQADSTEVGYGDRVKDCRGQWLTHIISDPGTEDLCLSPQAKELSESK